MCVRQEITLTFIGPVHYVTLRSLGNYRWTKTIILVILNGNIASTESFRADSSSFVICWHVELNIFGFQFM
jgi:hypothetical protein